MNRMAYLAGVRHQPTKKRVQLNEAMGEPELHEIIAELYRLAEEAAYGESAEGGQGVSGDQIAKQAQRLLKEVEDGIHEHIIAQHMGGRQEQEPEAPEAEVAPDEGQGTNQTQ